jgi:hypothetical protein
MSGQLHVQDALIPSDKFFFAYFTAGFTESRTYLELSEKENSSVPT